MSLACSIYSITHLDSGKRYIGSSINIDKRFSRHRNSLDAGKHHNSYLQHAWKKYGANKFKMTPVVICSPENQLFYEQLVIDGYKANNKEFGFNLRPAEKGHFGYKQSRANRVKRLAEKYGFSVDKDNPEILIIPKTAEQNKREKKKDASYKKRLYKRLCLNPNAKFYFDSMKKDRLL